MKKIIEQYRNGELETQPGRSMNEAFETRVNTALNTARDDAGKRAQESLTLKVILCSGFRGRCNDGVGEDAMMVSGGL